MATAQVPPAVGTSGQLIDVLTINAGSTIYREVVAIGGFTSSGIAVVTTSGGLTVNVTSGLITLSSATSLSSGIVTLSSPTSLSSGIVTLSSVPTVTATAATNPWSSAPSFNIPFVSASSGLVQISGTPTVVSASSGLVQISGTPTITIVGTSGAIAPATSSGGLSVTIVGGAASGSTAVNLVTSSGAFYPATSSGGLGVTILSGSGAGSTAVNLVVTSSGGFAYGSTGGGLLVELTNVDVLALSSGTVTLSSDIAISSGLVNLSSGTPNYVTFSSTPLILTASSGLLPVVVVGTSGGVTPSSTGGGLLVELSNVDQIALSSGTVTLSSAISISSGTINLSSGSSNYVSYTSTPLFNLVGTSSAVAPVTSSGGLSVTLVGGSVSAASTVATNPWSSAPSFNVPIVSASSGLIQIVGTHFVNIVGTSSGVGPVTTSGGQLVSVAAGTVTLSSVHTVTATAATNPWSSAPSFNVPIVSASSGLVQISGSVTATAATNPWSSAPNFNVPVVSASSGEVQVVPGSTQGYTCFSYVTSSSVNSNSVVSGNMGFHGYAIFNTTGAQRHVHLYNTSSAPTVGSTANFLMTLSIPGSTAGGAGANMVSVHPLSYSTRGLGFTITDSPLTTSTGIIGNNDLAVNLFYVT